MIFCLGIILFIATRIGLLLFSCPKFLHPEELYQGYIALEIINGLRAPIWNYQVDPYTGGSIFIGGLASLFFRLLGHHLFALKLAPFVFSLLTSILMFIFMKRHFGIKPASTAFGLLIFCPPTILQISLYALGSHSDVSWLEMGMLLAFYAFLYRKDGAGGNTALILCGLTAGFAFWFSTISLIALTTCLIVWVLRSNFTFNKTEWGSFGLFFLIGLTPFWIYQFAHHLDGVSFFGDLFYPRDGLSILQRLILLPREYVRYLLVVLPASLGFDSFYFLPSALISWIYYLLILAVLISYASKQFRGGWAKIRSDKTLFFFLYPVLYMTMSQLTQYRPPGRFVFSAFSFRYLAPLYLFAVPLLSLALREMPFGKAVLGGLIFLGGLSQLQLAVGEPWGRSLKMPGFAIEGPAVTVRMHAVAFHVEWERFESIEAISDFISRQPEGLQKWFYFSFGSFLSSKISVAAKLDRLSEGHRSWIFRGMGAVPIRAPRDLELFLNSQTPEFQQLWKSHERDCLWGYGWNLNAFGKDHVRKLLRQMDAWVPERREAVLEGFESVTEPPQINPKKYGIDRGEESV